MPLSPTSGCSACESHLLKVVTQRQTLVALMCAAQLRVLLQQVCLRQSPPCIATTLKGNMHKYLDVPADLDAKRWDPERLTINLTYSIIFITIIITITRFSSLRGPGALQQLLNITQFMSSHDAYLARRVALP